VKNLGDVQKRLVVSSLLILLLALLVFFSSITYVAPIVLLFVLGIIGMGTWEFALLMQAKKLHPSIKLMVGSAVLTALAFFFEHRTGFSANLVSIVLFLSTVAFFLRRFKSPQNALSSIAGEFFGVIYVAIPLSYTLAILFPRLQEPHQGQWWVFYLVVITKMTDVGAYFVGKLWGKRKLSPIFSPKKTKEGALAGFVCATGASLLLAYLGSHYSNGSFHLTYTDALILGILLGIFAQLGDLAESLLKRDAGVKDSNRLPGLGGVLDIVDSLLFTAPLLYYYLGL
jgi:phosphatidate cytidylyltransferase